MTLEDEWGAFCEWRERAPVDEAWKAILLAKIHGKPPASALEILQDAYNRAYINKATFLAVLDHPERA
jgi:hypothetical protein